MVTRFHRLEIPRSENDIKKINESSSSSSDQEVVEFHEDYERPSDLTIIAHELIHVQESTRRIEEGARELGIL